MEPTLMQTLKAEVETLEVEVMKNEGGNKAAGVRARNLLSNIAVTAKSLREEILARNKRFDAENARQNHGADTDPGGL
jgi:hypothetical protein